MAFAHGMPSSTMCGRAHSCLLSTGISQVCPTLLSFFVLALFPAVVDTCDRWLMSRGRIDEARRVLAKYHGEGDENHPLVELELAEMTSSVETEGSDKRWWDYRELFNTRAARHRMLLALSIGLFGQLDLPPTCKPCSEMYMISAD